MDRKSSTLVLFVTTVFLFIISPMLFSDGMFMDGIYYATIARNWAEGLGTFWQPMFTETVSKAFYDHPPLAFFLEGIFFKLFGDYSWVERFYSLVTHIITALTMYVIWKQLVSKDKHRLFFFPLFLWIIIGSTAWSVCNNILENTLMIFTTLALHCMLLYFKKNQWWQMLFAGVLLFFGFLTKGFVAFFPLSFPFFFFLFKRKVKFIALLKSYFLLLSATLLPFLFLFVFYTKGLDAISNYINIQLIASLNNSYGANNVDTRFYILIKFLKECVPLFVISILLLLVNKKWFRLPLAFNQEFKTNSLTFIAVIFSGILPIMISMKQNSFYANPVYPLTALVFGTACLPIIQQLYNKINERSKGFIIFRNCTIALFFISIVCNGFFLNKTGRDEQRLEDVYQLIEYLPENEQLYISPEINREWSIYAYFYRYGHISFDNENPLNYNFHLKLKGANHNLTEGYNKVNINLNKWELFQQTSE